MTQKYSSISRRHLLKLLASGLLALSGSARIFGVTANQLFTAEVDSITPELPGRVVICRHQNPWQANGRPNPELVRLMLDQAMLRLTGLDDLKAAWQLFFRPEEVISLKVNAASFPVTSPALTLAVADSLIEAGLKANNIIIWDQQEKTLKRAGYQLNQSGQGVRCYGSDSYGKILFKKVFRLRYDFSPVSFGTASSRLSKIFSQHSTATINLPVLKDHYITGITATMKNMLGGIDNPEAYHDDQGNPSLADLHLIPQVRKRIRLNVVDLLKPLYHGGPHGQPNRQWPYQGIMIGTDKAAMDYLAWQMVEEQRKQNGLKSLKQEHRKPGYIQTAAQKGLGIANPEKIELIEIAL